MKPTAVIAFAFYLLTIPCAIAQEVLLPLRHATPPPSKETVELTLPFFDDFSNTALSNTQWQTGGTLFNQGYAPLPPTVGMATLDAFDANGNLYPTATGQLFTADTLLSYPIRLDTIFSPYIRPIAAADSIYLSFFYLPGGGYGNRWQHCGDVPESQDSLILEFYSPSTDSWQRVWATPGCEPDSLMSRTGSYWQFCNIPITQSQYLHRGFMFRFRNFCSLDINNKDGLLSNADQWNIDYVHLSTDRHSNDTSARDVAFVTPAPSLLRNYTAMPARQFSPSDLADSLHLTITNRYSQQLATNYGYTIYDNNSSIVCQYDGGFENAPVYWHNHSYQSSPAHSNPPLSCTLPVDPNGGRQVFNIVHGIREGVSGDIHTENDTISFQQVFDNYYAYDDGSPENGYGITSTSASIKLAYQFNLNREDTLTAIQLYFNRTFENQNENVRFLITVWDDNNGQPGNIIYQDHERRRPLFEGFNKYVRYILEEPLITNGTIYVGIEQQSNSFINIGFDRSNNASQHIFYLTGAHWQTSILQGALMLRPCFGSSATLSISNTKTDGFKIAVSDNRIIINIPSRQAVYIYNSLGQTIWQSSTANTTHITPPLPKGIYLVHTHTTTSKILIP